MDRLEYSKAFALNFVFYAAAIVVYVIYGTTLPGGVPVTLVIFLTVASIFFTWYRVRLIRPVTVQLSFKDRETFLAALDNTMQAKDRWQLVANNKPDGWSVTHRRYEARLNYGLYWHTASLEATVRATQATLVGPPRILRLAVPMITRMGIAQQVDGTSH